MDFFFLLHFSQFFKTLVAIHYEWQKRGRSDHGSPLFLIYPLLKNILLQNKGRLFSDIPTFKAHCVLARGSSFFCSRRLFKYGYTFFSCFDKSVNGAGKFRKRIFSRLKPFEGVDKKVVNIKIIMPLLLLA